MPAQRSARIAAGLSQEDLGKSINYSASQVSAVENGQRPPTFIAIIDENVLHRAVGGASIMAAQCGHLIERASQSNIQLHVVPASAGAHAGLDGPFILANGPDFEAAHLDTSLQVHAQQQRRRLLHRGRHHS